MGIVFSCFYFKLDFEVKIDRERKGIKGYCLNTGSGFNVCLRSKVENFIILLDLCQINV